ncbi:MAG TPA: hypothetical protein VIZ59_01475, partial [Rubrobacteraceae bacterium]
SDMAKTWAKGKLRLGMGKAMDQRSALLQVAELGADAFATFYVGPAYACAAVHLKLDLVTSSPRSASSFDLARGHVILKMLKDMDEADGGQSPFRNVVSRLEATWDDARKAAGRRPLDLGESERLNQFVVSIRRKFRYSLLPSSVYPYSEPGWYTANKWFKHWEVSLGTGNPSAPIEGVSKLSALRDALNAAWLFWLFHKHPDGGGARAPEPCLQVKQLEDQVLRLCSLIIEKQYTQRETQSVPNPGGS